MAKTRTVQCKTKDCRNKNYDIEVPDIGSVVICGVCGSVLAQEEPEKVREFHRRMTEQESSNA